ncbi:MAG: TetR/AcrR family transcriptional regulator [Asticcacaulis sp.]
MADTTAPLTGGKRQDIIDQAYKLFYDGGFHATGVDAVMAGTGISKRTLYKYFPSKEHLIEAVLQHYGDNVEASLFAPALARSEDSRRQILAIFDVRRELMDSSSCLGCLAMKAAQEYKGRHAGIEAAGRRSSQMIEDRLDVLCRKAGLAQPRETARQIALVLQGAVLTSQIRGDTLVFDDAKAVVQKLLA